MNEIDKKAKFHELKLNRNTPILTQVLPYRIVLTSIISLDRDFSANDVDIMVSEPCFIFPPRPLGDGETIMFQKYYSLHIYIMIICGQWEELAL